MNHSDRSLFWIEPSAIATLLDKARGGRPPAASEKSRTTAAPEPEKGEVPALSVAAPAVGGRVFQDDVFQDDVFQDHVFQDHVVPEGPLERRLDALVTWLAELAGSGQAFVADVEGLSLVDRGTRPELVAAAASVAQSWAEMRGSWRLPEGPSLAIDLEGEEKLYVLLAESRWGRLNLGFVTRRPLARTDLDRIAEAFQMTVQEEGVEKK